MFDWSARANVVPTTTVDTGQAFGIFDRGRPTQRSARESLRGTFEACLRTRAQLFAQVATPDLEGPGFVAERQAGGGYEAVEPTHPWAELLRAPSRYRTAYDVWYWLLLARDLMGSAHALFEGVPLEPRVQEVYPAWGRLQPQPRDDGGVGGYIFHRSDGVDITIPAEEVMELRRIDPSSPYESQGLVESLAEYISADLDAQQYLAQSFGEGRPPLFQVTTDEAVDPETAQRFGDTFRRRFMEGNEVAVMTHGMEADSLSIDPESFQMLEAQGLTHQVIYRVTGIPQAYFDSENANRSNSESAERKIRRDTIQPLLNQAAQQLTLSFRRAFGAEPGALRIRPPRALQPTPKQREEIHERRIARGVPPATIMDEEGEELPDSYEDSLSTPRVPRTLQALEGRSGQPEPSGEAAADKDIALNGAQVTAAKGIVNEVVTGKLGRSSAKNMLMIFFGLEAAQADRILEDAGSMSPPVAGGEGDEGRTHSGGLHALADFL